MAQVIAQLKDQQLELFPLFFLLEKLGDLVCELGW